MAVKFMLLVSRQGKIRLTKWFTSDWSAKEKAKTVKDVSQTVLSRRTKMCNVLEYKGIFAVRGTLSFVGPVVPPSLTKTSYSQNQPNDIDFKVVYRRYASLFFIAGTDVDDNELLTLEIIHRYVEVLDKWFLNVCELDIIFNFQQAYMIIGEEVRKGY
ncbi:hypothetical protein HK104_001673 [Borealophlyctis nickersoniae]|nr:hypothetical protein HK104_001673 [Borealophlyctis nickersoniae]